MYFDFFVNGVILVLFMILLLFLRLDKKRLGSYLEDVKFRKVALIILWSLVGMGLAISMIFYPALDRGHDINDAVEAASDHFLDGGNPYADEVVPRFSERYHGPDTVIRNDTYNYLPVSLIFYSGAYLMLQPIGGFWFPLTNLLLGGLVCLTAWKTFPKPYRSYSLPLISLASIFFMFDNIMLTFLLVSISVFFLARSRNRFRWFLAFLFLFLGVFVKMIGLLALAVLFLYLIQRYKLKDTSVNLQCGLFVITAAIIALISILPFGLWSVLDSTVFYFSDVANRTTSSGYGGTILTVVMGDPSWFSLVSNFLIGTIILSTLFIEGLYKRIFLAEGLLIIVTIKASQAIIVIPFYILVTIMVLALANRTEKGLRDDRGTGTYGRDEPLPRTIMADRLRNIKKDHRR